uniref:Major facilitator superfamily (MFS) profile domain-containing protein n=1 Tax=Clastoptera arizonana TaxID=38151 RepID=A0A1B6DDB5_9HEMI
MEIDSRSEQTEKEPSTPSTIELCLYDSNSHEKMPFLESKDKCEVITETKKKFMDNNNIEKKDVKFNDKHIIKDVDLESIISSHESEFDDSDEIESKPKVPDGGWGWMVVLASFTICLIADGISMSFGLLYSEFLNHFGASKSATSWIGSLFMAVPLLAGPIGSALVDKYGCRWMTILGGVISGVAFILSSFCNSIFTMYLTFGIMAGLGLGFCFVTAVVSIAYWFDKKRTLATSLGACGTGMGTLLYAPMTQYFIKEYGWRGTVLLLAGTFFNMCVCGAIMRDPQWWVKEQNKSPSVGRNSSCASVSASVSDSDFPGVEELQKLLKSGQSPEYILTALTTSMKKNSVCPKVPEEDGEKEVMHSTSVVNLPTFVKRNERVPIEVLESLSSNKQMFNVILENYPNLLSCRSISDHGRLHLTDSPTTRVPVVMSMRLKPTKKSATPPGEHVVDEKNNRTSPVKQIKHQTSSYGPIRVDSIPMLRRHFSMKENANYLQNLRVRRNSVMYRGAILNLHKYRLRASSCPDMFRNSMTTIARENEQTWKEDMKELLKGMFDFSMFLELHFLLVSLATILLFIWFIVPYFYLAEHLKFHNMDDKDASYLLSVIGATNTIGMIALGWAGDQPWMNVTKTYAVCLVACGMSTFAIPFVSDSYWGLMAVCATFGVFFASNFSFTPTILVELVPLEKFTTAYGLSLLCQGIGNLIGPPIGAFAFDVTQTWDMSFYLAGIFIILSGFLVALIPVTKNKKIWGSGPIEKEKECYFL